MRAPTDHVCRRCGSTIPAGTPCQLVPGQRGAEFSLSPTDTWFVLCQDPCALTANAQWIRDAARRRQYGVPTQGCAYVPCGGAFPVEPAKHQRVFCSSRCRNANRRRVA